MLTRRLRVVCDKNRKRILLSRGKKHADKAFALKVLWLVADKAVASCVCDKK